MTPKQFRDEGYLQEVNRLFLHPLGLALSVTVCTHDGRDGKAPHTPENCRATKGRFGPILDWRHDQEGILFDTAAEPFTAAEKDRADRIQREFDAKVAARKVLGCDDDGIQPLG